MITTADLVELQQIIDSVHGDPHHILGMHEIEINKKPCIVVRAFIPQAKEITVIDEYDNLKQYKMERIHYDGFFEVVINDRQEWFMYQLKIEDYFENAWTTYDPYSFEPCLTSLDRHLFGEGTHYEIYDKLGSHLTTIRGVEGVLFSVWAPNARRVCVVGDFNQWDARRHQMRLLERSGIWELFIPGVKEYDRYQYEIKTFGGQILKKSDPYANYAELRPSTCSLVYDLNGYEWNDGEWLKRREENSLFTMPMNIYEVHLGSWKLKEQDGNAFLSYRELAQELIDYVKHMGYTHIELLPITEHPYDGSWGYQVTGYYAVTSRYGNPKDFMYFVDLCHQNNIGVLLDWVPAHFPKDAHGLARFDGSALYEHDDPRQGEHPDWGTLIFNYGRSEVKNFLIANALFWIEKFHIDGLRVDAVASMLYLDYNKPEGKWVSNQYGGRENLHAVEFIKHMNSIINKRHPNVLMVAEESTSWEGVTRSVDYDGLGFSLKWDMGWMNDFLEYVELDSYFRKYHHNNLTFAMMYAYTERFMLVLSHDEVVHGKCSLVNKMPGDLWQKFANLRVSLGFMYGHPGKKLIFMGGEFGQFIEWDEKRSLDWFLLDFPHHAQMQTYARDLNHFYKHDKPLWKCDFTGGFEWIQCDDNEHSIISFFRKCDDEKDITIVVCNFTPVPWYAHRIGVPIGCTYEEVLNSDHERYGGSGIVNVGRIQAEPIGVDFRPYSLELKIPPLAAIILKPVNL